MRISRRLAVSAGVATSILVGAAPVNAAGVIVVTTTMPGVAADGLCSLAEAIHNANASAAVHPDCAAGANPTTIELSPAAIYTMTVPLSTLDDGTGLPQVSAAIAVNGHGAIIERSSAGGTPPFRLLAVMPSGVLTLTDVTLRGGFANSDGTGLGGGALLNTGTATIVASIIDANQSGTNGGGLSNFATLTVRDSRIQNNLAVSGGGGLRNDIGTLTLEQSVVTSNRSTGAAGRGGGIANHAAAGHATLTIVGGEITNNLSEGVGGAGVDNAASSGRTATVTITGAIISGNVASGPDHTRGLGGGIQNSFFRGVLTGVARVTVDRTVISDNSAVNGGGISSGFDLGGSNELHLNITRSEIGGNTAVGTGFQVGNGGGVYGLGGTIVISNSTISGNEALGTGHPISGLGGGVMNAALNGTTGDLTVLYSTITGNTAAALGGGVLATPFNGFAVTSIGSTIVAFNSSPSGAGCGVIASAITSQGSNVESGNTCAFGHPSDKVDTNPLLGPLAANGGPTRTHALLPGSPAIDAGDLVACTTPPVGAVDQRGQQPRPTGLGCDAGAYESAWAASVLTLNTSFGLSDGTKGTGRFALLADGIMVDATGGTGFWWIPRPGVLAIVTDATPRVLWVALFTSPSTVSGRVFGLDGSTLTGAWTGVLVN